MGRNIPRPTLVSIIQGITQLIRSTIHGSQRHLLMYRRNPLHGAHRTSPG
nr:MAG TPA: hypothetical protein [Caudoviricetes sp.]